MKRRSISLSIAVPFFFSDVRFSYLSSRSYRQKHLVCRVANRICNDEYQRCEAIQSCALDEDRGKGDVMLPFIFDNTDNTCASTVQQQSNRDKNREDDVDGEGDDVVGCSVCKGKCTV